MSYRLEFWNGTEGEPMNPFASVFGDMPSGEFATRKEAETAAQAYCDSYKQKGGGSNADWDMQDDSYWIRHEVEPEKWRFTRFMIAKA